MPISQTKFVNVDYALRHHPYLPVVALGQIIPPTDHTKYLGVYLDKRLNYQMQNKLTYECTLGSWGQSLHPHGPTKDYSA